MTVFRARDRIFRAFSVADGKELFRHEGFMSKEDILSKWKGLGVGGESGMME